MTVAVSDVKWYYPQVRDDTGSNGGTMTANLVPAATRQAVWPDVLEAERTAGSSKYRKIFAKIENPDNSSLPNTRVFLAGPTPGDDLIVFFTGTQTDIQSAISAPTLYGAGSLQTTISGGATTVIVTVEDWTTYPIFRDGDLIAIHDGYYTGTTWNNETIIEFATISGAPSPSGNDITLTLAAGTANGYTAGQCSVCSVIEHGDLDATLTNPVVTTGDSGTFDDTQVTVNNRGAINESITITFSSASAFDVVGSVSGSLGSGNITTTTDPTNSDHGVEYWSIPPAAWGGTFTAGPPQDTVTFDITPASVPIWEQRVVPAAASSFGAFLRQHYVYGESA